MSLSMPPNATLQRIDVPSGASPAGDPAYATGSAIAARCVLQDPTTAQKYALGDVMNDVTAVLYTSSDELPGDPISRGCVLLVQLDEETAGQLYQVIWRKHRVGLGLTHSQYFLKAR